MQTIKNTLLITLFAFFFLVPFVPHVSAQTSSWEESGCVQGGVATLACIPIVMQNIINFLIAFAGVVCVFIVIFAGFKFVTSEGDPEKVANARKTGLYAAVGFILVIASFMIMNLLGSFTGVSQLGPQP